MSSGKSETSPGEQSRLSSYIGLASTASKAVALAKKMGASHAEALVLRRVMSTCFIEKLQVTFAQRKVQSGVGIRVALVPCPQTFSDFSAQWRMPVQVADSSLKSD